MRKFRVLCFKKLVDFYVLLSEFNNEIDPWVIERLQSIGCDTAKSVLALDPADIAKRADLEDETVEEVVNILRAEFEEE